MESSDREEMRASRNYERRERMRREKQRQLKRRRMVKLYLRLAIRVSFLLLCLILSGSILWKGGKMFSSQATGKKEEGKQEVTASPSSKEEVEKLLHEKEGAASDQLQQIKDSPFLATQGVLAAIGHKLATDAGKSTYSFQETNETEGIYSDKVVSSHAVLVDAKMDTILAQKAAKERISPASMTKVLTVLVAAEALTLEDMDKSFTITREITDYGFVNNCSMVGFLAGEEVKVRDLLYGTVLSSGADAAIGLAVFVAGSQEAFVEVMNKKLEELGLSADSKFTNCVGLYDEEHYCTVYDMAVMMKAAMENEICRNILSARTYVTSPTKEHPEGIPISNLFLRRIEDKETTGKVVGAKTGFVVQSQNCAVSCMEAGDGGYLICVTSGATSSWRCIYDHVEIYNQYGSKTPVASYTVEGIREVKEALVS